jgi:probable F420-dependent oxidoreductase
VKFGAVFPTPEIGNDPIAIRDWAQAAEALGYSRIITYDHVLGAVHANREPKLTGPYTENDAFHEPFVLFGFLAGVTRKIDLMTGILILTQRQTALVAKQAVEVDLLSNGRLVLGVGTGWNTVEYESLGVPWAARGARLDEQVEVLRKLWSERVIDYRGKFHRIDRAGILPQPARPIPIWYGGFSEAAFARAARSGDGFLLGGSSKTFRKHLARVNELLVQNGRDPKKFGSDCQLDFSAGPEAWRSEIEAWKQAGIECISLRAMDTAATSVGAKPVGYSGPRAYIAALETFKKEVGF